jgi:hypothetical protein
MTDTPPHRLTWREREQLQAAKQRDLLHGWLGLLGIVILGAVFLAWLAYTTSDPSNAGGALGILVFLWLPLGLTLLINGARSLD